MSKYNYKVGDKIRVYRGNICECTIMSIERGWYRVLELRKEEEDGKVYTWERKEVYRGYQLESYEQEYYRYASKLGQVLS